MKAYSIEKILTGVVVLLFTSLSWGLSSTGGSGETQEQCFTRIARQIKADKCNSLTVETEKKACSDNADTTARNTDECLALPSKEEKKDNKSACQTAFDKYGEAATKEKEACDAFDPSGGSTCKEQAESCKKKLTSLGSPYNSKTKNGEDENQSENGFGALESVALASLYQKMGISQANSDASLAQTGNACVKSIDRKARAQAKKDIDNKRQELAAKIKDQQNKITSFKEDINKEKDSINTEQARIEKDYKQDIREKDKQVSDESAQVTKFTQEVTVKIRLKAEEIAKAQQNLANANMEYQSAMMNLTDDKISQSCTAQFEALKSAIVAAAKNKGAAAPPQGASAEQQQQYAVAAALAARGSSAVKQALVSARQSCYDQANMTRSKNKLTNQQAVQSIQRQIANSKSEMDDAKKSLDNKINEFNQSKTQITGAKTDADTARAKDLNNLNTKLTNLVNTTDEKVKTANDEIARLNAEIANLTVTQNFEVQDAYSEAEEAIGKGNIARKNVQAVCGCLDDSGNAKSSLDAQTQVVCSQVNSAQVEYEGKKSKFQSKSKTAN